MNFIAKPRVITAQQFVLGQPLPEGVKFHEACEGDGSCHLDGNYFVVTIHGQETIVVDGDWIVPEPDGVHFYPVKPDVMERNYQIVFDDPQAAVGLTPAAHQLRVFLQGLGRYLGGVAGQLERERHKESEASTVKSYASQINDLLLVPYSDFIPKERCPNCGWDGESVEWSGAGSDIGVDNQATADETKLNPPDIRTLDGAKRFLRYHRLNEQQQIANHHLNHSVENFLDQVWDFIPEGPGKTVFIRSLKHMQMDANCAIANLGA